MTDHTQDVRLDDLAATPAELSVVALAAHQAEAWKSGGGPGYGWSCGHEVDRPSARSHRMGCGATSPRQRDGEYRHGYFDTLAEADRAARAHVADAVLSAVTPMIEEQAAKKERAKVVEELHQQAAKWHATVAPYKSHYAIAWDDAVDFILAGGKDEETDHA